MTYWFVGLNNESKEIKKEIGKKKKKKFNTIRNKQEVSYVSYSVWHIHFLFFFAQAKNMPLAMEISEE